ncbi:thioredoxin family protein [Candidatus Marinimicrobia bacterium]|nr:thioredoxin family protein [Candidatus Neomarinimicrobiota bacterium]
MFGISLSNEFDTSTLENCVRFDVKVDRKVYFGGENLYLLFNVEIDEGFHIYSVHPEKSLSPTYVDIIDSVYFSVVGIINEPEPLKKFDKNFNQDIYYHKNSIQLVKNLKLSESLENNNYKVNGVFEYYACDESMCIPRWDNFSFEFQVFDGEKREDFDWEPFPSEYDSDIPLTELETEINKGLFSFILFAIGMGFLALLTPCVFPMIPITVSYFTKEGEKEDNNPVFSASLYALGIIVIFTTLGLLLSFTLGASGAGDLAANPWINIFIASLFIYLAFSLFGYYEIQTPSFLRQFSINQENRGGIIGILFMSLTFTLTSFTCTVAFVGALLATASQGAIFWPIIGMLSFSLAFASPFFLLALFPQYLSKLPKSGGWLNSVKVIMGFLEIAAAFKFISNVDLVWNWGIFDRSMVLLVWAIIFILMGLYLLGLIKMPFDSPIKKISFYRIIFCIIFLFIGIYLSTGLFNNKLHGLIESYLPPDKEEIWIEDLDVGYKVSKELNKPIFIDFTGYTCTNCRWMEINIFEEDEVKKIFENFILVKLYTDGKEKNHKKNRQLEIERFGTAALPYYVILSPDDNILGTFPGMDTNKDKFVNFLNNSRNKFEY